MKNNLQASLYVIKSLIACGVRHFVLSPGARNSPLIQAVVQSTQLTDDSIVYTTHFDERSAGFFALGIAKGNKGDKGIAKGTKGTKGTKGNRQTSSSVDAIVVLICTSGTAGANYYPAIIEAHKSNLPLFVITADRPVEVVHTGANQTIDQANLYGNYARHFITLPTIAANTDCAYLKNIVSFLHYQARTDAAPVHLNMPLAEPLFGDFPSSQEISSTDNHNKIDNIFYHHYHLESEHATSLSAAKHFVKEIFLSAWQKITTEEKIKSSRPIVFQPLILLGKREHPYSSAEQAALLNIVRTWNAPVFCDIGSFAKSWIPSTNRIDCHQKLMEILLPKKREENNKPNVVLHIGGSFIAKDLFGWLATPPLARLYVHLHDGSGIMDTHHLVTHKVHFRDSVLPLLNALLNQIELFKNTDKKFLKQFKQLEINYKQKLNEAITTTLTKEDNQAILSEVIAIKEIFCACPRGHNLFVGNSLPIRDADNFVFGEEISSCSASKGDAVDLFSNRGASGIDGLIATACGLAVARNSCLWTIIGDISALHDVGSLALLQQTNQPIFLFVINNGGGKIFDSLSHLSNHSIHNKDAQKFSQALECPHTFSFKGICDTFNLSYVRIKNLSTLKTELTNLSRLTNVKTSTITSRLIELDCTNVDSWNLSLALRNI